MFSDILIDDDRSARGRVVGTTLRPLVEAGRLHDDVLGDAAAAAETGRGVVNRQVGLLPSAPTGLPSLKYDSTPQPRGALLGGFAALSA